MTNGDLPDNVIPKKFLIIFRAL